MRTVSLAFVVAYYSAVLSAEGYGSTEVVAATLAVIPER